MSFKFEWPGSTGEFSQVLELKLAEALKNGPRPERLEGSINLIDFSLGTRPPELEILDIDDLREDVIRGLFRIKYRGDAEIKLQTFVQMNPIPDDLSPISLKLYNDISFANTKFVVPLRFRLSDLVISGVFLLSVDKRKGVTITFKNDPLEKISVNSNFENIPTIERYIKIQMETNIRRILQVELPAIIHKKTNILKQHPFTSPDTQTSLGVSSPSIEPSPTTVSSFSSRSELNCFDETPEVKSSFRSPSVIDVPPYSTNNHKKWNSESSMEDRDASWPLEYYHYTSIFSKFNSTSYGLKKINHKSCLPSNNIYIKMIKIKSNNSSTLNKHRPRSNTYHTCFEGLNDISTNTSSCDDINVNIFTPQITTLLNRLRIRNDSSSSTTPAALQTSTKSKSNILSDYSAPGYWSNTAASDRYISQRIPKPTFKVYISSLLNMLENFLQGGHELKNSTFISSNSRSPDYSIYQSVSLNGLDPDRLYHPPEPLLIKNFVDRPLLLHMKNISLFAGSLTPRPVFGELEAKHVILKKDIIHFSNTASIAHKFFINIKSNNPRSLLPSPQSKKSHFPPSPKSQTNHYSELFNQSPSSATDHFSRHTDSFSLNANSLSSHQTTSSRKVSSVSGKSTVSLPASFTKLFASRGLYERWLRAGYDPSTKTINRGRHQTRVPSAEQENGRGF